MNRCDDINHSCKHCANAQIDYWDKEYNYHCSFECAKGHYKRPGAIISFLEKHTCDEWKEESEG